MLNLQDFQCPAQCATYVIIDFHVLLLFTVITCYYIYKERSEMLPVERTWMFDFGTFGWLSYSNGYSNVTHVRRVATKKSALLCYDVV